MKKLLPFVLVIGLILVVAMPVLAKNARLPAIKSGANRVVELQRTDADWDGTWYWHVDSSYNATNLTGVTALGLLEAYQDTKDEEYLDASINAADFIMEHLGFGVTGTQYHARTTAPDIVFLHRLAEITGDSEYSDRAKVEWDNIKDTYPTAASLNTLFHNINRPSAWDFAFFLEAAHLSEDTVWAEDAAEILADTEDIFYYGNTSWYALNVAGSIRALVDSGYAETYKDSIIYFLGELVSLSDKDNGVGEWIQDTAYATIAFRSVGGAGHQYANELARWIARNQEENGGWLEGSNEYPEINGESVRALSSTIGKNVAFEGWKARKNINSSWKKDVQNGIVEPFVVE